MCWYKSAQRAQSINELTKSPELDYRKLWESNPGYVPEGELSNLPPFYSHLLAIRISKTP